MKLCEAPPRVRDELALHRGRRRPDNGELWFGDGRCAFCGDDGSICDDHCHATGLERGPLCVGCNLAEGREVSWAWYFWRRHAPLLARRVVRPGGRYLVTVDEALNLALPELYALAADRELERRQIRHATDEEWIAEVYPEAALDEWARRFADGVKTGNAA